MVTFIDGPAQGEILPLRRAPILLRVVCGRGSRWDALDQPGDEAKPTEAIFVYRLTTRASSIHICARGKGGKALSGFWPYAQYAQVDEPIDDVHVRTSAAWRQWCETNYERLRPEWAKTLEQK